MAQTAHPGHFVRMEMIWPLGLSITDAAKALGVTRPALSALLNGRAALSSEMTLRIEKEFELRMATLLRMQAAFKISKARKREGEVEVSRYIVKNPKTRPGRVQPPSPPIRAFSR